jgi:type II secretory pathway pseudopilin PulG
MKRRPGYTLIETLVSLAGAAVVFATATGLLYSMTKIDRATRDRTAGQQALRRLAADFRGDAHAAVKFAAAEAAVGGKKVPAWEFQMPEADRKARYQTDARGLVREEYAGGKVVRREAYRLPEGRAASMALEGSPPVAILRVGPSGADAASSGGPPFRIDAMLASDHRFAKLGGK